MEAADIHIADSGYKGVGTVNGGVHVENRADVELWGDVNGGLFIESGAAVKLHGTVLGGVFVSEGASLEIAQGSKVGGGMFNDGSVVNYGYRQVRLEGSGSIDDRLHSTVVEPLVGDDGKVTINM
jgi:hypothetical protein